MKIIDKSSEKEVESELITDFSAYGSLSFHVFVAIFLLILDLTLFEKYGLTMLATYLVLIVLRSFYFDKRPWKKKTYKTLVEKIDMNSKFSSHSASSFAFAITIGLSTTTPIFIFLLVFAFLVGLSRIKLRKHRPTNVLNGAIIGIIVSLIINLLVF